MKVFYEGSWGSQALHNIYSPGALECEMEKHSRKLIVFQKSCLNVPRVQNDYLLFFG